MLTKKRYIYKGNKRIKKNQYFSNHLANNLTVL